MSSIAIDQQPGLAGAGRVQQIEPRGVAVEDPEAELAQQLDLVGVVVEHGGAHPAGEQQAADDLPEAAEARDDAPAHPSRLDRVVGDARVLRAARAAGGRARTSSSGVSAIDSATTSVRQRVPCRAAARAWPRDAEHHERELAALARASAANSKRWLRRDAERLRDAARARRP